MSPKNVSVSSFAETANLLRELQEPDVSRAWQIAKVSMLFIVIACLLFGTWMWNLPQGGITFIIVLVLGPIALYSLSHLPKSHRQRRLEIFRSHLQCADIQEAFVTFRDAGVDLLDRAFVDAIHGVLHEGKVKRAEIIRVLDLIFGKEHSFVV